MNPFVLVEEAPHRRDRRDPRRRGIPVKLSCRGTVEWGAAFGVDAANPGSLSERPTTSSGTLGPGGKQSGDPKGRGAYPTPPSGPPKHHERRVAPTLAKLTVSAL